MMPSMGERRERERNRKRNRDKETERKNHLVFIKEINEAEVRNQVR